MRAAFGLLGVLITLGVIIWVIIAISSSPAGQKIVPNMQQRQQDVEQFSGRDINGAPAGSTIWLAPETKGGKMTGVIVTKLVKNGAMERHFGLQKDDTIVEIGPQPVSDMGSSDAARDFLVSAYQTNQEIVVIRDEKRIKLPGANTGGAGGAGAAAGAGGTGANGSSGSANPVEQQLQKIQKQGQ